MHRVFRNSRAWFLKPNAQSKKILLTFHLADRPNGVFDAILSNSPLRRLLMKGAGLLLAAVAAVCTALAAGQGSTGTNPDYIKNNQLLRPADYRDWVYLSSGLGMNYSASPAITKCSPMSLCRSGRTHSSCRAANGRTRPCSW